MSAPEQPTFLFPTVPTFGGYAPEQSQLQGVTFWPRVGARVIDMLIHYLVSFISGIVFVIMLVIASGGHASPVRWPDWSTPELRASSLRYSAASPITWSSRQCTEALWARLLFPWWWCRKTARRARSRVL